MENFPDVPEVLARAVRGLAPAQIRGPLRYITPAGLLIATYLHQNFADPNVDAFLDHRPDEKGGLWYGYSARLLSVADTLFALRSSSGFPELCRRLRGRDLRSTFFEAFAARSFHDAGFDIVAVPERGVKGEDFDFQAQRGSEIVNVEVTALRANTFSINTVMNALNQKRKQLPKDVPSVIWCVFPESWMAPKKDLHFAFWYIGCRFLSQAKRINALVTMTEVHAPNPDDPKEGSITFPVFIVPNVAPRTKIDLSFLYGEPFNVPSRDWPAVKAAALNSNFYRWVDSLLPKEG